ncbi:MULTISPECIES: NACHT domain-containing NTPase [unclassified Streptomyces]|uniref:NACHT domain-containing protein n=1 Tax=unclassified Streptomyces TaxID=2593676 RepID=UPI00278BB1DF|nr:MULTISPECIES: NACHT domain-containing protein [unclassified Streptomyces]
MSVEAAAIALGRVVVNRALGRWLAGRRRERETRSDLSELVRAQVPDVLERRAVKRQFEQMGDAVAARLKPLLAHEFRDLSPAGRQLALDAVTDAFVHADLSDAVVIGSDADPAELARAIRRARPAPSGFDEATARFHELVFTECCDCYVRILQRLPVFTERVVSELLKRTTSLGSEITRVLERLPARSLYAPEGSGLDAAFRREYLELVGNSLDEMELFSFSARTVPRVRLSLAYVSLRARDEQGAAGERPGRSVRSGAGDWVESEEDGRASNVESALRSRPRILLRGEAGSGKTTLLRWLAVTAARAGFTGELAAWNGLVPAFVKLRRYAGRPLPRPEELLDSVADPITGHMPAAWMDRQLADKQVLLLVDGVDELLAEDRSKVRDWLRNLLLAYPDTRVVVTSRPAAAHWDWLRAQRFEALRLNRMRPSDLVTFVRQWHEAIGASGGDLPCPADDLPFYERSLLVKLQDRAHLQALVGTPLLAALLCALHLDRHRELPPNRMELYRIALETLVQRRDAERGVPMASLLPLSLTDKLHILQALAWRLSDNNRSEITLGVAAEHVALVMRSMRHLDGLDHRAVLDQLLERSGVLRSPAEGWVDFTHRSFQEYLAAAETAAQDRMGNLVERAHLDLWRETVVMAAGHANQRQRVELVGGVLDRADTEPRHRRALRLLAAACLETMTTVPTDLVHRLDHAQVALLPPRRTSHATSLATIGAPLLRSLPYSLDGITVGAAAATVRTAALIGGPTALDRLAAYAKDPRPRVHAALAAAWEYFDAYEYAQHVLTALPLERTWLSLTHPAQWTELLRLRKARRIAVQYPIRRGLAASRALGELDWLWLPSLREENDLSPLRERTTLRNLSLWGDMPLPDVSPVAALPDLMNFQLQDWHGLPHPTDIPLAAGLKGLGLGRFAAGTDLSPLLAPRELDFLLLQGDGRPVGLDGLCATQPGLGALILDGFDLSHWLYTDGALPLKLTRLDLRGCVVPQDLSRVAALPRLREFLLYDCRPTRGDSTATLSTLARAPGRRSLTVRVIGTTPLRAPESPVPGIRLRRV